MRRRRTRIKANLNKKILSYLTVENFSSGFDNVGNPLLRNNLIKVETTTVKNRTFPTDQFLVKTSNGDGRLNPFIRTSLGRTYNFGELLDEYGAVEFLFRAYKPYNDTSDNFRIVLTPEPANSTGSGTDITGQFNATQIGRFSGVFTGGGYYRDFSSFSMTSFDLHMRLRLEPTPIQDEFICKLWCNGSLKGKYTIIANTANGNSFLKATDFQFINPALLTDQGFYFYDYAVIAGDAFTETEGDYDDYHLKYDEV